eukprot:6172561-Pleurochrysis_carterae.AAC.1
MPPPSPSPSPPTLRRSPPRSSSSSFSHAQSRRSSSYVRGAQSQRSARPGCNLSGIFHVMPKEFLSQGIAHNRFSIRTERCVVVRSASCQHLSSNLHPIFQYGHPAIKCDSHFALSQAEALSVVRSKPALL